jgi:hypothetical protein
MSRGILEMAGFMTTLVFAVPLTIAGADLLRRGNVVVGLGLLGAAAAMFLVNEYVTRPSDLPTMIASKVAGTVVDEPAEEDN